MEHTKLGTNEEKPTGEATVTSTGMHRDRESIDDFEHVVRESSPVDKTSKKLGEFDFDNPSHGLEEKFMPKQGMESKVVGLAESSTALGDEWAAHTKSLIDSSGLESFLRNEKGFISTELEFSPGLDEIKRDMPKTGLSLLGDKDPFKGPEKVNVSQFISTEASHDSDKDKQGLLGKSDSDSSPKTEFSLGFPVAADKVVEGFKTTMFDDDFLQDTLPSAKSAAAEEIHTEDLGPSSFTHDFTHPTEPVFKHEPKDLSSTEFASTKDLPSKEPELKDIGLPSKLSELKDLPSKQEQKELPSKNEPTNLPLKQEEPVDLLSMKESAPPKQQPTSEPLVATTKPKEAKNEDVLVKPAKESTPVKEIAVDEITEPMELFCKMGLDAWFKPERLHPTVVELVYWRDPKKSGIVFGTVLGVLLSLSYFSLISVIAYLSLAVLTGTIAYRIYKNIVQAVQKTSDGHPFKDILDLDLTLPQDKVRELTDMTVNHLNAAAVELRRLFLVEDLVDSIKFGVLLWCMTYVGSWFNGMTIIIIMFAAMFTLPKVYENNKTQIDQNLEVVRAKLGEISAKLKAAVPIGKKPVEEKKEQ